MEEGGCGVGEKIWCKVVFDCSFAWSASLPPKIIPDVPARAACPPMTDVGLWAQRRDYSPLKGPRDTSTHRGAK